MAAFALTTISCLISKMVASGLCGGKVAASGPNHFVLAIQPEEFETVAKSASLADRGENLHLAERKCKLQFHNFTQGNFDSKQRRDSGFAEVYGIASQHPAGSRMDADINL